MKYIKKVVKKEIYHYSVNKGFVELWDFSRANENEESRKEAICLVASISYGNESCKNPDKLWNLLIEKGHESVYEFIRQYGSYDCKMKDWNLREIDLPETNIDHDDYEGAFSISSVNRRIFATFKLKVPIFVARQIQRHRSFSYMEMSRRYVKDSKVDFEFWYPDVVNTEEFERIKAHYNNSSKLYGELLENNHKPEVSRSVIPQSLYTIFWIQGDYKAWLNFFIYRLHSEAQKETREVAQAMWKLLKEHQPEIIETMKEYIDEWVEDCNPIFIPARKKRAEWFKKEYLEV